MAFRQANLSRLVKFNSSNSSDLIALYEAHAAAKVAADNARPSHKTFAPSSFRCPRISWFRLRGVDPDEVNKPDLILDFSAQIGTACHEIIQANLEEMLGDDWIDVGEYLSTLSADYEYELTKSGHETLIELKHPYPVRFACDGIIRLNGKLYLLEIKTSEYASFNELMDPKPQHIDQVKCYSTLLELPNVLMLYQDRQYGSLKCYEKTISQSERDSVWDTFKYVTEMVECNIAPTRLDRTDSWCTASHCPYYKKCREWG